MELRAARKMSGKTQVQVAKEVGIAEVVYQRYEYSKSIPSVRTAIRIARALGSTVEALFGAAPPVNTKKARWRSGENLYKQTITREFSMGQEKHAAERRAGEGGEKMKRHDGKISNWAWNTWGIMLAGVILNIIGIAGILTR